MTKKTYKRTSQQTTLKVTEPMELMAFLSAKMGGMSRNSVKSLLSHRQVMVNNRVTTQYNTMLKPNDIVFINRAKASAELHHPKLKIIFEDNDLIVVEKKEGLQTAVLGKKNEMTAFSILKDYVKKGESNSRIYTIHRLDREVSGILVFAKNRDIQLIMQNNWHRNVTQRIYTAVVEGAVEKAAGRIESIVTENNELLSTNNDVYQTEQKAVTDYRRIKNNDQFSLLEITLKAGEKNQIRQHLHEAGHPIVGDKKYDSIENPLNRLGLHARLIEFYHPVTHKKMKFEMPVPRKFLSLFH